MTNKGRQIDLESYRIPDCACLQRCLQAAGCGPMPDPARLLNFGTGLRFLRKLREKLAGLAAPARRPRLSSALLKTVTAALLRHSQRF